MRGRGCGRSNSSTAASTSSSTTPGTPTYGPVEEIPLERWRREFETNLFGAVRLTQLVLPGMRERGRGRIVNMSSMGGRLAFPLGAPYHGTKFALEAVSDVLRVEVRLSASTSC